MRRVVKVKVVFTVVRVGILSYISSPLSCFNSELYRELKKEGGREGFYREIDLLRKRS